MIRKLKKKLLEKKHRLQRVHQNYMHGEESGLTQYLQHDPNNKHAQQGGLVQYLELCRRTQHKAILRRAKDQCIECIDQSLDEHYTPKKKHS